MFAKHAVLTTILAMLLSACGDNGPDNGMPAPPPPPAAVPTIDVERVFPSLSFVQPLGMLQAPGDSSRWFVVEKRGVIHVFDNDPAADTTETYLDLRGVVNASGEGGLLGVAFHPGFPTIAEVYVSYTRSSSPLVSWISRFSSTDGGITLDAGTEELLLTVEQFDTNHNGGHIAFGPDGFFYAGFGDGGGGGDPAGNGQNRFTLPGSLIRLDVDNGSPFTIPASNPFAGNALCVQGAGGAECPEIFAWGFRNPWRFSFDDVTGRLWLGDVGQGSWEEIDLVVVGENYGWNTREGAHCFSPSSGCSTQFVDPVTEYPRGNGGSVTGGYVYRGSAIGELTGWYVFGDFVTGRLYAIEESSNAGVEPEELLDSGLAISSFATDGDGELYVVDYAGGLYQVIDAP